MAKVPPSKLVKLSLQNATQVIGAKNWAAVQNKSGRVIVEAVTAPRNNAEEWKQIRWSGDTAADEPLKPNRRTLALDASKRYHLEATLGGVTDSVDLWVLWATVQILTKGMRPGGAAMFEPFSRDNTQQLGAVTYKSLSSSVIDEKAGVFVENTGASGKVAPVATLSPTGIYNIVRAGWVFAREIQFHTWVDGVATKDSTTSWRRDTSKAEFLRLTPDSGDKIYDLDGPDIRWGLKSYETYNNFRQWIEWNGERCSDYALWYWRARWKVDKDPKKQILLNDLGTGNVPLPNKPSL